MPPTLAPRSRRLVAARAAALLGGALLVGCAGDPRATHEQQPPPGPVVEAGFVDVAPRAVTVGGKHVSIEATARLFYDFVPADTSPESRPIFVLFNGFSDDIIGSFGTGPATVEEGGDVVPNPSSLTSIANLLYVEPRQAGFSYDVVEGRSPTAADCSPDIFNEYVDAADVLLGVLAFLDAHPRLEGPIDWVGESYGGVRVQWILNYLRDPGGRPPYVDPTLRRRVASTQRASSLFAGQVLLEPWLVGSAHADAIAATCLDAATVAAVSEQIGGPCTTSDACQCAVDAGRSLYNFSYTETRQDQRVFEGQRAHVTPDLARRLLGVPLDRIDALSSPERRRGFKCDAPDDQTPDQTELFDLLGPLPPGQVYYLGYGPLQPGKELAPNQPDWLDQNIVGLAFLDNLRDVPTLLTDGHMDLVVPERALVPALKSIVDPSIVDDSDPSRIRVVVPEGERFVDVRSYPEAGHMITMIAARAFAEDVTDWIGSR